MDIKARQNIEIAYWKNSSWEAPDVDPPQLLIYKMGEAAVLYDCLERYRPLFENSRTVLEIGAGQGWGSCLVKKLFPKLELITSDISQWAIASLSKWERIFQVKVNEALSCTSDQIPRADASVDLVFTFAAAHHFATHRQTLREIKRILRPGGSCLYFYEPVCPAYIYKLALWRVNRKRPEVPEDVLITKRILALAREEGLEARVDYYPQLKNRGPLETLYFWVLSKWPFLSKILPSTANFVFVKSGDDRLNKA